MLQTLKRTYDDVMAGLGERFDALDMRDRDDYLAWMAQVHYIVRHSTRLLALASAYTSLDRDEGPPFATLMLHAVRHGLRGQWQAAHELAQAQDDATGAWVHAWLHRIEGDLGNADYWYRRAGCSPSDHSLEEEWHILATDLLGRR